MRHICSVNFPKQTTHWRKIQGIELDDVLRQIHGDCSGFVADFVQHCPAAPQSERYQIMAYFKQCELPVLHTLAENFLICDRWFSSVPGPTWTNRFFVHSGTSLGHVDMPNGFFHPGIHCYDQPTVYDHLNEKGISWEIYFGDFPQSFLLTHQLEHSTGYHHLEKLFEDVVGPEAEFPQYSFIEPYYFGAQQNDQMECFGRTAEPPAVSHFLGRNRSAFTGIFSAAKALCQISRSTEWGRAISQLYEIKKARKPRSMEGCSNHAARLCALAFDYTRGNCPEERTRRRCPGQITCY